MSYTRFIYDYNGEEVAALGVEHCAKTKAYTAVVRAVEEKYGYCDLKKLKFVRQYNFKGQDWQEISKKIVKNS